MSCRYASRARNIRNTPMANAKKGSKLQALKVENDALRQEVFELQQQLAALQEVSAVDQQVGNRYTGRCLCHSADVFSNA